MHGKQCGCKKKKPKRPCGCKKCHKKKQERDFKRAWKRISTFKPAKGFKVCTRSRRAHCGKYMKGNQTRKVPYIRVKTIRKRRKGGVWLEGVPTPNFDKAPKPKSKFAFLK